MARGRPRRSSRSVPELQLQRLGLCIGPSRLGPTAQALVRPSPAKSSGSLDFHPSEAWHSSCSLLRIERTREGAACMRQWYTKIIACLRFSMGLWLILNVSIATIPRCDQVLDLLQGALPGQVGHGSSSAAVHCESHDQGHGSQGPAIAPDTLCRCSLAQFIPLQLTPIAQEPEGIAPPRVLHLIAFRYDLRAQDFARAPDIPPPRRLA